jgi:hypothetical protein
MLPNFVASTTRRGGLNEKAHQFYQADAIHVGRIEKVTPSSMAR